MNEVQALKDAIKLAEKRLAEIEKPKYPDGTTGYLWDDIESSGMLVSLINTGDTNNPYSGTTLNGRYRYQPHKNFAPLETCIMGMRYENTGEYPGHEEDFLLVVFNTGKESVNRSNDYYWGLNAWDSSIKYYYIIKRFEG